MAISKKIKLSFIWASLLILCSTILFSLVPIRSASAAPIGESRARRYVAGLVQCLMRFDDVYGAFDAISESNLSNWTGLEYAVVGLDMETPNGVVACGTALNEAAKVLANKETVSEAQIWLQNNILPQKSGRQTTFRDWGASGGLGGFSVYRSQTDTHISDFMNNILIPYVNSIPVDARELAERMLILADFCYGYNNQDFSPSEFSNRAKTIFATTLDISPNQAQGFVPFSGASGWGDDNSKLGDVQLLFDLKDGLLSGPGGWRGVYTSNFLPIGADNMNLVNGFIDRDRGEGSAGRGSIQDCNVVKDIENQYGIFDFYELDANSSLTFEGKTAQDVLDASTRDVNLNFSEGDNNPSCEGADALGWIACPIIAAILNLSDTIFQNIIVPFLTVDPINTNGGTVFIIWSAFRTIGNIMLVFALLFIVFGQSIGGGLVDAYTAKKAMPRIFIGAILINLSIYIVAFMVDMGNILGAGIGEMITSPLAAAGVDAFEVDGLTGLITFIGAVLIVLIPVVTIVLFRRSRPDANGATSIQGHHRWNGLKKAALYFAFLVGIPLMLLIFGIFITLIIRLGTILLLCIISPVALSLFVMPATEKWAKKWFDLLVKTILVYPIIVAIFGISAVLATLLSPATGGNNILKEVGNSVANSTLSDPEKKAAILQLDGSADLGGLEGGLGQEDGGGFFFTMASILVLFAPLAMIPFSFKLAGGLMGSLIGAVSKGRGGFDKMVRGDKHNPHSRFYNMIGKDGKITTKYGKEVKPFGIRSIAYSLKRVGKKRGAQGLMDKVEDAPDINASLRARYRIPGSTIKPATIVPPTTPPTGGVPATGDLNPDGGVGGSPYGPTIFDDSIPTRPVIRTAATSLDDLKASATPPTTQPPVAQPNPTTTKRPISSSPEAFKQRPSGLYVPPTAEESFGEPKQQADNNTPPDNSTI